MSPAPRAHIALLFILKTFLLNGANLWLVVHGWNEEETFMDCSSPLLTVPLRVLVEFSSSEGSEGGWGSAGAAEAGDGAAGRAGLRLLGKGPAAGARHRAPISLSWEQLGADTGQGDLGQTRSSVSTTFCFPRPHRWVLRGLGLPRSLLGLSGPRREKY